METQGRAAASAKPANNEQRHVVVRPKRSAELGNVPDDAVGHRLGAQAKVSPQRMNQAFFGIVIAVPILRLCDAVGIQDKAVAFGQAAVRKRVPAVAKQAQR